MADRIRPRFALFLATAGIILAGLWAVGASSALGYTGINLFSMDVSSSQAGGHPDIAIHAKFDVRNLDHGVPVERSDLDCWCEDMRDNIVHMPTGFIGNPHGIPRCTLADFGLEKCTPETQVGVLYLNPLGIKAPFGEVTPVYNLYPHPGEAGLISTVTPFINTPILTSLSGRTGSDYGLDAVSRGAFHWLPIIEFDIYLWGAPADPSHDLARFPLPHGGEQTICVGVPTDQVPSEQKSKEIFFNFGCHQPTPSHAANVPYLQNPTTCGVPLSAELELFYYTGIIERAEAPWPATTGCDQLTFNPSLTAKPTTTQADTAAGIDIDLSVPQPQSASVPSPSEIRETVVTMPRGFALSPNGAEGKTACADEQLNFTTEAGAECPEFAKIGTLELDSSALPGPIPGAIYIGKPLPGSKFRVFFTADGFATHVKLKGTVGLDPETGQIVTTFKDLPQSPFQEFDLHFFGSERGVFATPTHCGSYQVQALFVPWDAALPSQTTFSSFDIDSGPEGTPCPPDKRPFDPGFKAGTPDNTAGVSSPLGIQLTRKDGDQTLKALTVKLPSGLVPSIKGVSECPQSALDALMLSSHTGLDELMAPACPASSQIGTITTGAGAGTRPLYNNGKVFLAGPYKGAPLSVVVVIPALGGPYDLGNIAVRTAAYVDPVTAQIKATSDPIPQIIEGVPVRARSVLLTLDRPGFNRTPTNCDPKAIEAEVTGDQGAVATRSAYYQVGNCSSLAFEPKLALQLAGATKRTGHPALKATLTAGPGEANIAGAQVTLPRSQFLDNAHIDTLCTRVQFAADACPPGSVYGTAEAATPLLDEPLKGPVYLRSSDHKLPDLVVALGGRIDVELVGRIDTVGKGALRTTFETVPDAPVSSFTLRMAGGAQGLLVNSENLCKAPKRAAVDFIGQNGAELSSKITVQSACGGSAARKKGRKNALHSARRAR